MNTPAHLLIGAAAFTRAGAPRVNLAVLAGAVAPDLSLYLLTAWSIFVRGVSPDIVFRDYYFSPEWQRIFAIDNSFVLWSVLLIVGLTGRWRALTMFAAAGLLHLACDFPLHHDDARMHFWPISDWVFHSPVSYWDRSYHAGLVGPMELALSLVLCVVLWRRFHHLGARIAIAGAAIALIAPNLMWRVLLS